MTTDEVVQHCPMRIAVSLGFGLILALGASPAAGQNRLTPDAPRPIAAGDSLWAEELTFMDVREAVRGGTTTIIIGTGGVEQNGPYVAGGKHNFVLQTVLPYIAREIGHALIAPIVKFVPEGDIEPTPTGHMAFAGTISVEPATFEALLTDICRSYKAHGFTDIILLGDSGGNQAGMERVAAALNGRWAAERRASTTCASTTTRISGATTSSRAWASRRSTRRRPRARRPTAGATGGTASTTTFTTRRRWRCWIRT